MVGALGYLSWNGTATWQLAAAAGACLALGGAVIAVLDDAERPADALGTH